MQTASMAACGRPAAAIARLAAAWVVLAGGVFAWVAITGVCLAEDKVSLIGDDLSAWREDAGDWRIVGDVKLDPADPAKFVAVEGTGAAVNGPTGRTKHLVSKHEHGDVEARIEFVVPKGSNSGVYFQGRYEIQILDSWGVPPEKLQHGDCGGIYERWGPQGGYEGHPPRVNASLPPGQWQSFDVIFRAPRFDADGRKIANARFVKVVHNGKVIHENVEVTGPTRAAMFGDEKPTGPLMLQGDHGPVAYRNVWIRPLRLKD
jgi:hypothetical protein